MLSFNRSLISVFVLSLFFSLPSFSASVAAPKTQQDKNQNNVYTEDKQNFLILGAHPEFTIKLKSNPTTGYSWFLREYDSNILTPLKHSFLKSDTGLMGAPGYELWTFKVKPTGFVVPQQSTIRFIYARPWQGSDSSTQLVFRISTTGK